MQSADAASSSDNKDVEPLVEIDPTKRYGRYQELLGSGSVKKVYKALDLLEGKEVAWNQISLKIFAGEEDTIKKISSEIKLLNNLKNENIINLCHLWKDTKKKTINFITEVCVSASIRNYLNKHSDISMTTKKKWCRQILKGLEYLHSHDPCVIHRDLNCSNIFLNGDMGQIKIGDLGVATIIEETHKASTMVGTPEFMAPELYEENYTENVDIYSFGMCLLEMVTHEIPYSECGNVLLIYKNVTSGIRPKAMEKVTDMQVKHFIEKCLDSNRPSASELLQDQFFDGIDD